MNDPEGEGEEAGHPGEWSYRLVLMHAQKFPRGLTIGIKQGIKQLIAVTCLSEPPHNLPLAGSQFVTEFE